ncbi:TKL protein kinase [Phytophthora nicotianae CJ01A1]|uniref:TKL protein kinase n=3 Tax=Phytophthora nicotianae TaxID=4792 RepID=V9EE02_PHYNI|nr:TKL protein kinase [Phytophthora nicotianae P1569]ETK77397.1 TKL protein kinase [Phytophthora nicotianae]ETM37279.1 TKL protein kinase [Phytophthora nicotianae]ETP07038.1 TKL protein kinase [Phytophthora nicotianae CJ01A1]
MRTRALASLLALLDGVNASVFRRQLLSSEASGASDQPLGVKEPGRPQFNLWLVLPLTVGFLAIMTITWIGLCYRRYRKQRRSRELMVQSPVLDLPCSEPYESNEQPKSAPSSEGWHTLSLDTNAKPFGLDQTFRVPPRSNEVDTCLPTLLEGLDLAGKRIPTRNLHIKATLSTGASGEVWLAQYKGRRVAVKQLLRTNERTAKDVKNFVEEIILSASLNHLHVVSFIGVAWSSPENLSMVMEYCPMGDLRRFLVESGRLLSWSRDKIRMAVGIAQALRYIHGRDSPIIHRDLKPKNILLTDTLEAKISDFGLSRTRREGFMTAGVGTPYWIAPEILEGKRYTELADIYSFGVVLSELDTCKTPFSDVVTAEGKKPKPLQILHWVLDGRLSPSFTDKCPRWIRSVGMQCLQHDPGLRPTAAELTQVLWVDVRHRIYTL